MYQPHETPTGKQISPTEGATNFVNRTGRRAVIGTLDDIEAMVKGTAGTSIELPNNITKRYAIRRGAVMNKTTLNATQISDEVKKRLLLLPNSASDPSALSVPLPRKHPLDAQSRNWDMDEIETSSYKRRVIEEAREAFFFSDEEEADELVSNAFTKS